MVGMAIWDGIETYFCPIKKFRNEIETFFFYLTCIHETRVRLVNSVSSVSLPTKNENIFNWDGIPQDPISFGTGSGHIFIPKKI